MAPQKVIYIAGYGRSGSTLLDIALGSRPGIFGAGELTVLSRRAWTNGDYCACGSQVRDCGFWKRVIGQWLAGSTDVDGDMRKLASLRVRFERLVSWKRIFKAGKPKGLEEYQWSVATLFRSISRAIGGHAGAIVDSSKLPGRGFALAAIDGIELYVVHLIRDPRAVSHSLSKPYVIDLERGVQREIRPKSPLFVILRWSVVNLMAELLCRYVGPSRSLQLRYEDFVADPPSALEGIERMCGQHVAEPDGETDTGTIHPAHQVAGNRLRMKKSIAIHDDQNWLDEMPVGRRRLVSILCAPMLRRYGYTAGRPIAPDDVSGASQGAS